MDLRVTQQTVTQSALANSQRLTAQLALLQTEAATGSRINNVSDDPLAAVAVMASTTQDQWITAHLGNVQSAQNMLNASVSALQDASSLFSQARSLAIEASNSTNDQQSLDAIASQVDGLLRRLVDSANTQQDGLYVFGGSNPTVQPFVVTSHDSQGNPLQVTYQGSTDPTSAIVDTHQQVIIRDAGSDVFMRLNRQAPLYTGTTGAAAGTGTDTATGQTQLVLTHTATTFTAGSGVQPGASSAAQDTILGSAGQHRLHIIDTSGNGSAGTVSLDGSTPINFTNADGNLLVTNGNGDAVYLDMTAITPNFNGNVDITSNGTMSVDGGVTSTPIAFSANQIAQDSATGQSIFVNTFAVERTGTEIVDHPGTSDAFQTLMQLRDLLRNVNHLSPHDQLAAISNQISNLDQVRTNILDKMGEQSASLQSLDSLQSHLQDMQLAAKKNISELSDVDVSELVVKLQTYQQQLQLSLASFARINSHSLLDFLQ